MINITERLREEEGLFSMKGIDLTFFQPEVYGAGSLQDFLKERDTILASWKSRIKFHYHHTYMASVFIKSCLYQEREPYKEILSVEEWKTLEATMYADHYIKCLQEEKPFNPLDVRKEIFNRFQNGQLYDTATTFPVRSKIAVPQNITLYNVWLRYAPKDDFAEIEGYSDHDDAPRRYPVPQAKKKVLIGLWPLLEPA